ncbi:MAG: ATP-binding protein [Nannocystales bacterium]
MSREEELEKQLTAASNQALLERCVQGSIFYPVLMLIALLATDWSTEHVGASAAVLGVMLAAATVRFVYLRRLLKTPSSYLERLPSLLVPALFAPSLCVGLFTAATLHLFGITSFSAMPAVLVAMGMAAGGTSALAMKPRIHLVFLGTLLVPIGLAAFALGAKSGISVGLFTVLLVVFLRREGQAAHADFVGLVDREFALHEVVAELKAKQGELVNANDSMCLVLDNVEEGLCVIDTAGNIGPHSSRSFERLFGTATPGQSFAEHLGDRDFADWFGVSFEMLAEGCLDPEIVLEQLPTTLEHKGRHLRFGYTLIERAGEVEGVLVVVDDVTDRLAAEEAERDQGEMVALLRLLARDADGFREFRVSGAALVRRLLDADETPSEERRTLHTLKGNAALMGVDTVAKYCHDLESELDGSGDRISPAKRRQLSDVWAATEARMTVIFGEREGIIEISEAEYSSLLDKIAGGASSRELAELVRGWRLDSVPQRLARMARSAEVLAVKLGKQLRIELDGSAMRLDPSRWREFWSCCVHLIRNSVDHGIEDQKTRVARGKDGTGTLWLSMERDGGDVVMRVRDDGGGIDWERVALKAEALGLPFGTQDALEAALFTDGLSTKDRVSATSGRGVGLSALAKETLRMGGSLHVHSLFGEGTQFTIRIPDVPVLPQLQAVGSVS